MNYEQHGIEIIIRQKLRKTFGKFFRSYSELLSKFGDISFQEYLSKGISHPVFYGDLVYKLSRVKDTPNFFSSGSKIVKRLRRRQYDPVIIERTIGLVLGPSTALYEHFLKHCTLPNKAVGTIWRALSKPPQRRQGPDLCPLWLLVGTPSAIIPELAFSRAEHSRSYSDVAKYIFDIYYLFTMLFVYWFLWPLRLVWLLVCCLYKEVYLQIFKCVSFWLHGCCGEWEGGPVNQVNHTIWMAVVTPNDRPKSVRNCCLIELFCGVVCVVTLPFWHFCWCRGFCHRTESDHFLLEANSSLMVEEVPTNNQRGRRSGPCRPWWGLGKARHIVLTAPQRQSTVELGYMPLRIKVW